MTRWLPALVVGFMVLVRAATAQGISLTIAPDEAPPGSTVMMQADLGSGAGTQGVSLTASLTEATKAGGPAPAFVDQVVVGDLARGALTAGSIQPDGSYRVAIVIAPAVHGPGILFQVPIAIPSSATPGSVFQLSLSAVSARDDRLQPQPVTIASGLVTVAASGAAADDRALTAGDVVGRGGARVDLPIRLGAVSALGSLDLTLQVDGPPNLLWVGLAESTDLSRHGIVESHVLPDGRIRIALIDPHGLDGPGDLLRLPAVISSSAAPGSYALHLLDVRITRPSGQALAVTARDGRLIVLSGSAGSAASLDLSALPRAAPGGMTVALPVTVQDATGAAIAEPDLHLALVGPDAGRAALSGGGLIGSGPGVVIVEARSGVVVARAAIEIFTPARGDEIFSPVVYARPGSEVRVPIFYAPATFAADLVFDMTVTGPAGLLPAIDGQPMLGIAASSGGAAAYAESGAVGALRIWTRGLIPVGTGPVWIMPLRLPTSSAAATAPVDLVIRYAPVASTAAGGEGAIRVAAPTPAPGRLIQTAGSPIAVGVTPSSPEEFLWGEVTVDDSTVPAAYLVPDAPSAALDRAALGAGAHTIHVVTYDRTGEQRITDLPFIAPGPPKPGDLNSDGVVDLKDVTLSLQIAVGVRSPTADQRAAGDLNGDGRLDLKDAILILTLALEI